jgi:Protein of unknown function (DUF1761)
MAFAGISSVAIVLAAVASFMFGALWYGLLGNAWVAALGKTKEQIGASISAPALPYAISFLSLMLMAWVLAGVMGHVGPITVRNGIISALFVWAGFVATTITTNHRYSGQRWSLTFIDAGHWLGALLVQGAVIGVVGS